LSDVGYKLDVKLTLTIKLDPTDDQADSLLRTMERFNAACDWIAEAAFREQTASKIRLQKIVYRDVRERFRLSAQMTIRAISKTCEAYKRDRSIQPRFRPHGAIVYDQRIMSWKGLDRVSLLTLDGREIVRVRFGAYQEARLDRNRA
jgi:predicted transposase